MGELHTRMTSSGHLSSDRVGLRTSYLPALRYVLTKPLATLDKEGIPQVIETMSVCTAPSACPKVFALLLVFLCQTPSP